MRILHTSDWHIGRQFHQVSLLEDQRHVLQQLVTIAKEQEVDVVVIAGDLYDRAVPPANAVALLDVILQQLICDAQLPVVLISGNHDSPERLNFASAHLTEADLYMLGKLTTNIEPVRLLDEHGPVYFYGLPYADPMMIRDTFEDAEAVKTHDDAMRFLIDQCAIDTKQRNVLLSHCFVGGAEACDSERPLSIGGADQVSSSHFDDFNYVALGHLHGRQYRSKEHIRYSGSIMKYSFSEEKHIKSVTLVDMDEQGQCEIQQVELTPLRNMRTLEGALDDIIEQGKQDPHADDYLQVRLTDTHAILEPMQKLRAVYPNVLHLERPGLLSNNGRSTAQREKMLKGEWNMFEDFYQQVHGDGLSEAQQDVVKDILKNIHDNEAS